jgi:uncharacterized protein (TIGR03905 family)
MKYQYCTQGTCSRLIDFEIVDGIIKNVRFTGGCNGNLQGIASLVEGQRAEDVIPNSCPDQLARALKEALNS